MQNKTLSIMFVDVQGYTLLTAQKKRHEQQLFVTEIREFVEKHVQIKAGKLIKAMGDGFLVTFESPTDAIACGVELQKEISRRNANVLNSENLISFRIGISTGEVNLDDNGDVFGDVVNIAARIQKFAEPNEVFISESTYLAMNAAEIKALDLGPQKFKNVVREVRVFKVLKDSEDPSTLVLAKSKDRQLLNMVLVVAAVGSIGIVLLMVKLGQKLPNPLKTQNETVMNKTVLEPQSEPADTLTAEERLEIRRQLQSHKEQIRSAVREDIQQEMQQLSGTGNFSQQPLMQQNTRPTRIQRLKQGMLDSQKRHPCGDGVCDQFERNNPNLCPQDCNN